MGKLAGRLKEKITKDGEEGNSPTVISRLFRLAPKLRWRPRESPARKTGSRERWAVSPLTTRILAVNVVALLIPVGFCFIQAPIGMGLLMLNSRRCAIKVGL